MRWRDYNPYQRELWRAWNDAYYAAAYGYGHTRMPAPGQQIDTTRYQAWKQRVVAMSQNEAGRYASNERIRGMEAEDWPENLWLYLYQQMLAAERLKPEPANSVYWE